MGKTLVKLLLVTTLEAVKLKTNEEGEISIITTFLLSTVAVTVLFGPV